MWHQATSPLSSCCPQALASLCPSAPHPASVHTLPLLHGGSLAWKTEATSPIWQRSDSSSAQAPQNRVLC